MLSLIEIEASCFEQYVVRDMLHVAPEACMRRRRMHHLFPNGVGAPLVQGKEKAFGP